jgi:hypothetical protein
MRKVNYLETRFTGRLDFVVVRYSVKNVVKVSGILESNCNYTITGVLDFFHCTVFYKLENTTFRKLDLFPSSDEGWKTPQLGPLERANVNHWPTPARFTQLFNHLRQG